MTFISKATYHRTTVVGLRAVLIPTKRSVQSDVLLLNLQIQYVVVVGQRQSCQQPACTVIKLRPYSFSKIAQVQNM